MNRLPVEAFRQFYEACGAGLFMIKTQILLESVRTNFRKKLVTFKSLPGEDLNYSKIGDFLDSPTLSRI